MTLLAPRLSVAVSGLLVQLCGSGDSVAQPGTRFRVPVAITNVGNFTTIDGYAKLFAQDRYDAAQVGEGIVGKMAVETPQIAVGTLAPGASKVDAVTVTLARDAACGTSYGLLFTGGVDIYSSAPGKSDALVKLVIPAAAQCHVFTGSCANAQPKAAIACFSPGRSAIARAPS